MKKYLLAVMAMLCISTGASALDNEPEEGLTWQGQVGMNLSNIRGLRGDVKPGANLGFYGQYMFENAHGTYVNFGLNYGMEGAKRDFITLTAQQGTSKYTTHYINVPVHLGFQYNVLPELGFFADFGPYFGVGVGGKNKADYEDDALVDRKYNIYKANPDVPTDYYQQRFDWGLGFRVGAEYNEHYSLNMGFNWGLTDLLKDEFRMNYKILTGDQLVNHKNFNFSLTLGYRF